MNRVSGQEGAALAGPVGTDGRQEVLQALKQTEDCEGGSCFQLRIDFLREEDLSCIAAIEMESHVEPWSEASLREELHRPISRFWVAHLSRFSAHPPAEGPGIKMRRDARDDHADLIAGYICCWLVADELQILNVTVHKRWRRGGIGKAMLAHALEWGRTHEACSAALEVRKSNMAAQLLYRKMGFQAVGERPEYYGIVKEAAVMMERVISHESSTAIEQHPIRRPDEEHGPDQHPGGSASPFRGPH